MKKVITILFFIVLLFFSFNLALAQTSECLYLCNDQSHILGPKEYCEKQGGTLGNTLVFDGRDPDCSGNLQGICSSYQVPVCCCGTTRINPLTTQETPTSLFKPPDLKIDLGINFSKPTCTEDISGNRTCEIHWLGEYTTAIYNIALKFGGLLAAIMLMAGGVLWLISGGDTSKISQAKEILTGSVIGLTILLSSYILLVQINPELINLKPVTINLVTERGLPDTEASEGADIHPIFQMACAAAKRGDLTLCKAIGNKRPEGLINHGGVFVHPDTLKKFNDAMQCVAIKNNNQILFRINEGFRSAADQIRIKKNFEAAGKSNMAAVPCCSNHSSGIAIDLKRIDGKAMSWSHNDSTWLKICMNAVGLFAEIPGEPWHWSPTGR